MSTLLRTILVCLPIVGFFQESTASKNGWARAAVIMACSKGLEEDKPLKFAYEDAKRVKEILGKVGDIPPENIFSIQSESLQEIEQQLINASKKLEAIKQSGTKLFLQFYYSGHGGQSYFHLSGKRFAFEDIKERLNMASVDAKVFILDVCYGASFFTAKGFKPVDIQPIKLNVDELTRGEVIITASSINEQAYEVMPLKGSVFTNHWLMALRGAGDENQDGSVSLFEAYNYTYHKTVAYSSETLNRPQHPTYAMELQGGKDLILTRPKSGTTTLRFEDCPQGNYSITDVRRKLSVGDIHLSGDKEFSIALEPGVYEIYTRHPQKGPLKTRVSLAMQGITSVPYTRFTSMGISPPPPKVSKGSAAPPPIPQVSEARRSITLEAKYIGGLRFFKDDKQKSSLKQTTPVDDYFRFSRKNEFKTIGQIHGALVNIRYYQWLALGVQLHLQNSKHTQSATGFEPLQGSKDTWQVTQETAFEFHSLLTGPALELRPFHRGPHSLAIDAFYGWLTADIEIEWSMQRPLFDNYESAYGSYSASGRHVSLGLLYGLHKNTNASLVPHFDVRLAVYHQNFNLNIDNTTGTNWKINSEETGISFQMLVGLSTTGVR